MPLTVGHATCADLTRIANLHIQTFSSNPIFRTQYPTDDVVHRLHLSIRKKAAAELEDGKWTILVVRDTAHENRIVAFSKWMHPCMPGEGYEEPPWTWPAGTNLKIVDKWFEITERVDEEIMGHRPCYRLYFIGTDPEYERQGAATMMVKWGVERSRREGVPIYVQCTLDSTSIYLKQGFVDLGTFEADLDGEDEVKEGRAYVETSLLYEPLNSPSPRTDGEQ